jgi:hypothetical protein
MAAFADTFVLKLNLPYSEYWLPLAIGMSVGLCALTLSRLVFGRKKPRPEMRPVQSIQYDPFTQGSPTEQRKSYRRQGNPVEVFIALAGQKDRPARGLVLDRSIGGICLLARSEFKAGTPVAVLPTNAPNTTPWVDIEVRSCRESDEGYELGCQFVKTPNWSILLLFG